MKKKPSRKFGYYSASATTTTVTYSFHNHQTNTIIPPPQETPTHQIPIHSSSNNTTTTTHNSPAAELSSDHEQKEATAAAAATKIQSAYRAHVVRAHFREISSVHAEAERLQREIQRQETVDAVRSSEKEKVKMNEALMGLLFRLDSVPGVNQAVREARRKVSRRIVGLQEILDAVCEAEVVDAGGGGSGGGGLYWMRDWDEVVAEMEEEVCRERGGDEMERFCAEYLGFRCLQRFLREP
ncbi:hypothetical protein Tsubulata_030017 [Turnera subulata]|uniref:BAG domain-containing protein n=1 Tax=Turnera subulata TaxID=218843 RepID=A0A9Q0F8D9_9ROSI|nr:hypothetical protein Tsubulata_030017 [Turnera subulata]